MPAYWRHEHPGIVWFSCNLATKGRVRGYRGVALQVARRAREAVRNGSVASVHVRHEDSRVAEALGATGIRIEEPAELQYSLPLLSATGRAWWQTWSGPPLGLGLALPEDVVYVGVAPE